MQSLQSTSCRAPSADSRQLLAVRLLNDPTPADGGEQITDSVARGFDLSDDACAEPRRIAAYRRQRLPCTGGSHEHHDLAFIRDFERIQPEHLRGVQRLRANGYLRLIETDVMARAHRDIGTETSDPAARRVTHE